MNPNPLLRYTLQAVYNAGKDEDYYMGVGKMEPEEAEAEIKDLLCHILLTPEPVEADKMWEIINNL